MIGLVASSCGAENAHDFCVTILRSLMQWGVAIFILRIDISPRCYERFCHFCMTIPSSLMQRSVAIYIRRIDITPRCYECFCHF